jgi:hypothetical protein
MLRRATANLESLGEPPFDGEKREKRGLEKLGFPWILSSEMSLFNGLRAIFGKSFLCAVRGP